MDLWAVFYAVKAHFSPSLLDTAEKWLTYTANSAWLWFVLAMLAAVWITRRFVVRPLSRLIDSRPQPVQLDGRLHVLANELKYVRLVVDELRGSLPNPQKEHETIEEMRLLADDLRAIVKSLRNERDESEELRSVMHEIGAVLKSVGNDHNERTDELRSGLSSLIDEYEQTRTN